MRCLVVRFLDCEGPGILLNTLQDQGFRITFHNAYNPNLDLMPDAHQMFEWVVFMGGPQSILEDERFLKPYIHLAENLIATPYRKVIGICLGAQIIAKALGARVYKGDKGPEAGFGSVEIAKPSNPVFSGIEKRNPTVFHLHEDTFDLPNGAELLLKGEVYTNQMFAYLDRIFGIQCHMEVTLPMLKTWEKVHSSFIERAGGMHTDDLIGSQKSAEEFGRAVFDNLVNFESRVARKH